MFRHFTLSSSVVYTYKIKNIKRMFANVHYRLKTINVKTVVLYILIIKRSMKSRLFICSETVNYDVVNFFKTIN